MIELKRLKYKSFCLVITAVVFIGVVLHRIKRSDDPPDPTPEDAQCFLATPNDQLPNFLRPGPCGDGDGGILTRLSDVVKDNDACSAKDISTEDLHASSGVTSLADLLLARGLGRFLDDWESDEAKQILENTYVCEKHKMEFGFEWFSTHGDKFMMMKKKLKTAVCRVSEIEKLADLQPVHTEPMKLPKKGYVNRKESQAVLQEHNVLLPIGMLVCQRHKEKFQDLVKKIEERKLEEEQKIGEEQLTQERKPGRDRRKTGSYRVPCSQDPCPGPSHVHKHGDEQADTKYKGTACERKPRSEYEQQVTDLQKSVLAFAKDVNVDRVHLTKATKEWKELKPYTLYEKVSSANKLFDKIYQAYAPECPADFKTLVLQGESTRFWKGKLTRYLEEMVKNVVDLFQGAETAKEQKAALSFVTPPLSYADLLEYIPGLTRHMFKGARNWRRRFGSRTICATQDKDEHTPKTPEWYMKADAFISYLSSPFVVIDLPHGEMTMKTSRGKVAIPAIVRAMRASRIVDNYMAYLTQNQEEHLRLSRATLFRIIACCTARYSKALAGIDSYTQEASEGFDTLISLSKSLSDKNNAADWAKEITTALKESKQYLRGQYRMHLKKCSKVSDHCIGYALSDPSDSDYAVDCENHQHNDNSLTCVHCNRLINTMADIGDMLEEAKYDDESKKNADKWFFDKAVEDIMKYKAHLVRSTYNEMVKKRILDELDEKTVFVTLDWAMKYLPAKARESQTSWFGKRGLSWHIGVALIKQKNGNFHKRTLVHLFQQSKQSSSDVTAIISHILEVIHSEQPQITHAIIRSDNAGCYKSSNTIIGMAEISKRSNIIVTRWIFSEPQSGKGPSDRAAARIKRRMTTWLNEKPVPGDAQHDITNTAEFLTAASSFNGLRDVSLFSGTITEPEKKDDTVSGIPSITKLYDFHFMWKLKMAPSDEIPNGIYVAALHAFRMPQLGDGKTLTENMFQTYDGRMDQGTFTVTDERHEGEKEKKTEQYSYWKQVGHSDNKQQQDGADKEGEAGYTFPDEEEDEKDDDAEGVGDPFAEATEDKERCQKLDEEALKRNLFDCPYDGCIKQYFYEGNLARHILTGKHVYRPVRESSQDIYQRMYAEKLESLHTAPEFPQMREELELSDLRTSRCQSQQNLLSSVYVDRLGLLKRGWALQQASTHIRFNLNQLTFLNSQFDIGKRTNKKCDPKEVSKSMPEEKTDGTQNLRFEPAEFLTATQIMSFFSRRAALDRKGETIGGAAADPCASPPQKKPKPRRQKRAIVDDRYDLQLEMESPNDCEGYVYVRRDEYLDDENYETDEDNLRSSYKECIQ